MRIIQTQTDDDIIDEAIAIFTSMTDGTQKQVLDMIKHKAIDAIRCMIQMGDDGLMRASIGILADWCLKSAEVRDAVVAEDTHMFIIGTF